MSGGRPTSSGRSSGSPPDGARAWKPRAAALGKYVLRCPRGAELLFVDNETNPERWRTNGESNRGEPPFFFKDGINEYLVGGREGTINPRQIGTKAAARYTVEIPPGGQTFAAPAPDRRGRRGRRRPTTTTALGKPFAKVMEARKREADEFYAVGHPGVAVRGSQRGSMRQSLAGMLWSKQFYDYDVDAWLTDHGTAPSRPGCRSGARNADWSHMVSDDVISMPDKWEYPWYAAWDLAFHSIPLSLVDPDFAKKQLLLLLQERYLHPNGQVPAYEWNFGDVNPPVHAWAAYFLYQLDRRRTGHADVEFLQQHLQQAAAELHLVGQSQGSRPGATCSRAAFSASTASASSIGARRCRPAATSSRRTGRRGWRSSRSRCCRSRWSWRSTIGRTPTWR